MTKTHHHHPFDLEVPRPPGGHASRRTGALGRLARLPIALALLGGCADVDVDDTELDDEEVELELRSYDLAPDPDLIAWLRFDRPGELGHNEMLFDRHDDYDCFPTAVTAVDDGRRAAGFDGQSSACSFFHINGTHANGAEAVSMSVWVRPREMDGIIYRQENGPFAGYQIEGSNGKLRVGGRAKSTDSFGSIQLDYPFALDTWHHVVGVIDYQANRISIYLDGALALSQTGVLASGPTFEFTPGSAEMIGAYVPGGYAYFDGRMDELRVYARALSATDVQTIYLATLEEDDETAPLVNLEFESADTGFNSGVGGNCVATGIEEHWSTTSAIYTGQSRCSFPTSTGDQAADWGSATVSAWINPSKVSEGVIYRQEIATLTAGYQMTFWNGALTFGGRSTASDPWQNVTYPWPYASNSGWYHVAGVIDYEDRELRLYVNGVLQASSAPTWAHRSLPQPTAGAAGPLTGMRTLAGTETYQGGLDELRVYTRSFDDDEIPELF